VEKLALVVVGRATSGHAGAARKLAICAVQQLQPQKRKNNLKQESELMKSEVNSCIYREFI
jgi:hypothetical protein